MLALAVSTSYERVSATKTFNPDHMIVLKADKAEPALIIIKTGETVGFVPQDGIAHHIKSTASSPTIFDSGELSPKDKYQIKFELAGNYDLFDVLHPKIQVKVVVYDPSK